MKLYVFHNHQFESCKFATFANDEYEALANFNKQELSYEPLFIDETFEDGFVLNSRSEEIFILKCYDIAQKYVYDLGEF